MLLDNQSYIIADGRDINTEINSEKIEEIRVQIMKKYEASLKRANLFGKIKIYIMIKSETRKKIEEIVPSKGLYFKSTL